MAASARRGIGGRELAQDLGRLGRQLGRGKVQEAAHDGRQSGRAGDRQPGDDLGGHDGGVVSPWHGAVAPRPANVEAVRRVAFLGDLDGVQAAAGHGRGDTATFVDGAGRQQPVGPVIGDPLGPVHAAGLLVRGAREQDVAPKPRDRVVGGVQPGCPGLGRQEPDDAQLHRHHALHVDRAAPVDIAAVDVGCERVVGPAIGRGGHDVEMRQQEERFATGAVAAQPRVDGATAGDRFDDLRGEARLARACRRSPGPRRAPCRGHPPTRD